MARIITTYDSGVFYQSPLAIVGNGNSAVLPFGLDSDSREVYWECGALILTGANMASTDAITVTTQFYYDAGGLIPATTTSGGTAPYAAAVTLQFPATKVLTAIIQLPNGLSAALVANQTQVTPLPPYVAFIWTAVTGSLDFSVRRHLLGTSVGY